MKKGTARPPVRNGRSTRRCVSAREETKKAEAAREPAPAVFDAEWAARLQAVQEELASPKPPRGPRVGALQPFVRKQIKKALPALCQTLLGKAKEGDVPTMKLLWQMAELDKHAEPGGEQDKDRKFIRQTLAKYRQR